MFEIIYHASSQSCPEVQESVIIYGDFDEDRYFCAFLENDHLICQSSTSHLPINPRREVVDFIKNNYGCFERRSDAPEWVEIDKLPSDIHDWLNSY